MLRAFMEGGPELAETAFFEQREAEECDSYKKVLYAKIEAITYIGFFHKHHLMAVRFGTRGFLIMYAGPYESADPSPNTNGYPRPFDPNDREA